MTFGERFLTWQYYAHYALLAILATAYYYFFGVFNKSPVEMAFELAIVIFVIDTFVHGVFWVLPKPYQWRE